MNCEITRRIFPSKISPKFDINYFVIRIRDHRKEVYKKQLNPIYSLREHLEEIQKTFPFTQNIDDLCK